MRRRSALVSGVILSLVVAGCGSGSGVDDPGFKGPLTWASYGGKFQDDQIKAWQEPSTAKTGITFQNVSPFEQAQLKAMVEAGKPVWDIVTPDGTFVDKNCDVLFAKLSNVDPKDFLPGTVGSECTAPAYVYANIFAYDADVFASDPPTTIEDFFDTARYPGKRIVSDYQGSGLLEAALVADGVDPGRLYPLDLDRAFKKLDTIKDNLTIAPSLGALGQALTDKQAVMTLTVTARMITTVNAGANLKPVWDFTTYTAAVMAVPKGVTNLTAANKAIAAILTEDSAIKYAELTGTGPALASVTPDKVKYGEVAKTFNYADKGRGTVVPQDPSYWRDQQTVATARWNSWKIG